MPPELTVLLRKQAMKHLHAFEGDDSGDDADDEAGSASGGGTSRDDAEKGVNAIGVGGGGGPAAAVSRS
jgi:hypothetical protein